MGIAVRMGYSRDKIEKSILGLGLYDIVGFDGAMLRHGLCPDRFTAGINRNAFNAIAELAEKHVQPDGELIAMQLKTLSHGEREITSWLLDASDLACLKGNVDFYAGLLREESAEATVKSGATKVVEQMARSETDAAMDTAREIGQAVADSTATVKQTSMRAILREWWSTVEKAYEKGSAPHVPLSGFSKLEFSIGGILPGELLVVAGPTSVGKSSFLRSMARELSSSGHPVGIVSVEDPESTWMNRFVADEAGIPVQSLRHATLNGEEWSKAIQAVGALRERPLYLECLSSGSNSHSVTGAMRRLAGHGIKFVFVDYLQAIQNRGKQDRHHELSAILSEIKGEASELGLALVVSSQVNRESQKIKNETPSLWALKESGDIENIAESVAFLWCGESHASDVEHRESCISLYVAKSKNGTRGRISLSWTPSRTRYEER